MERRLFLHVLCAAALCVAGAHSASPASPALPAMSLRMAPHNFTATAGPTPSTLAWVIAFTGPVDQCEVCAALEAEVEDAAAILLNLEPNGVGARVGIVRVDDYPELAARFGVPGDLPVVVSFAPNGGAQPRRYVGDGSAAALVDEAQWVAMSSARSGAELEAVLSVDSICAPLLGIDHRLGPNTDAAATEERAQELYTNLSARVWGGRCEQALLAVICASAFPIDAKRPCHSLCALVHECADGALSVSQLCAAADTNASCVTDTTVFPTPLPPALDDNGHVRIRGWAAEEGFGTAGSASSGALDHAPNGAADAAPLAVLLPFVEKHVALLTFNIGLWAVKHIPCTSGTYSHAALYLYFNGDLASAAGQAARAVLVDALRASDAGRCFSSVRFIAANLSTAEDNYSGAGTGASAGTVNMFYPAVHALALRGHV
jgi:hypothetical protein